MNGGAVFAAAQPRSLKGRMKRIINYGFAAGLGAVCGLIAGHYFIPAVPAYPLSFWFEHPIQHGHWPWALGGIITGSAVRYLMVTD